MKGPQPSKKGRTPGPAGEGKGAVRFGVSISLMKGVYSRVVMEGWR